jgi:hypothetical protein
LLLTYSSLQKNQFSQQKLLMMAVEEDFPFSHFANKCQNPENKKKVSKMISIVKLLRV